MLARFAIILPCLMLASELSVARYGQGTCFGGAVLLHPYDRFYTATMLALATATIVLGTITAVRGKPKWVGGPAILLALGCLLKPF